MYVRVYPGIHTHMQQISIIHNRKLTKSAPRGGARLRVARAAEQDDRPPGGDDAQGASMCVWVDVDVNVSFEDWGCVCGYIP